jgi:hypothetical protein
MKILSIDIGITNLGYVFADIEYSSDIYFKSQKCSYINVISCNRVDITNVKHRIVKECNCNLRHDRCIPDYLDHFVQENNDMFDLAEIILIERQPPVGITNVQDLLFVKFRSKVLLISPRSVHKFFKMSNDYSLRKAESENIAMCYLSDFNEYNNNVRRHDISDAMLFIIFYCKKFMEIPKKKSIPYTGTGVDLFEQFRFINLQKD